MEHARTAADRMAAAAGTWLESLDAEQREVGAGRAPADGEADADRLRWFYTPTDHGGLTLHQQRPAQQQLTMRLVASGLSPAGYVTVATLMGLENVLDHVEGFPATGSERRRDPDRYYLRVFGAPGGDAPWGWRFGGHHVSLNNLVVDGRLVATTPCFLGANPAAAPLLDGSSSRPLGGSEDIARELVRSLHPEQAARAVLLPRAPSDIVSGNRSRIDAVAAGSPDAAAEGGRRPRGASSAAIDEASGLDGAEHRAVALTATPKGLPASELDTGQRVRLLALLGTYLGRVPDAVSPLGRYGDAAALDAVHLAWAGSTEPGRPHYYRLQGPRLLVEWDNTQGAANHAHSVWRDPESDFGLDVLAAHRAARHRGRT